MEQRAMGGKEAGTAWNPQMLWQCKRVEHGDQVAAHGTSEAGVFVDAVKNCGERESGVQSLASLAVGDLHLRPARCDANEHDLGAWVQIIEGSVINLQASILIQPECRTQEVGLAEAGSHWQHLDLRRIHFKVN